MNAFLRIGFVLLAAALPSAAQLDLFVIPAPGLEQPASPLTDMGTVAVADSASIRFRVRNPGRAPVTVTLLHLSGAGFSMTGQPSLPYILAAGANLDFLVRFTPPNTGDYSATLSINAGTWQLRGAGSPGAYLQMNGQTVASGGAIDCGRLERGGSASVALSLMNPTSGEVRIAVISVAGAAFTLPDAPALPAVIPGGATLNFRLKFQPESAGLSSGLLVIDGRTWRLTGTADEPPLPRPTVIIETPAIRSGEQGRVSVRLAEASRAYAKGQLRMELRPADGIKDNDAAAQFLTGSRTLAFEIVPGDQAVRLNGAESVAFQAGTTTGTLLFTVEAGGFSEQTVVSVAPEPVRFDKLSGLRSGSTLELTMSGFDNTRSVSEVAFTFYANGQALPGMPVRVAASSEFGKWWSASQLGGIFQLRAAFPVTGDITKIQAAEVQITSSAGVTASPRISF